MIFQPELGQMAWSNTEFYEHDAPELLIAALNSIGEEIERVMGNLTQKPYYSPTGNVGGEAFINDTFSMRAYCWCDGGLHPESCPPNFTWLDLGVSWYKHLGRGTSCNRPVTPNECAEILTTCLDSLRAMDVTL